MDGVVIMTDGSDHGRTIKMIYRMVFFMVGTKMIDWIILIIGLRPIQEEEGNFVISKYKLGAILVLGRLKQSL